MESGRYTPETPPDPLALFQLQNTADPNSNVYAFQMSYAGSGVSRGSRWGFDIVYEPIGGDLETREYDCMCRLGTS